MKKSSLIKNVLMLAGFASITFMGCEKENGKSLEVFSTKPESISILQKFADEFCSAKGDGTVITIVSPADAGTVLRARLAKDDIPDIILMGGDATYTEFASSGVLMDLSDEDFISSIQPNYLKMLYDINADRSETAYAIPYATNASGVLYNKDLFNEAGVTVPQTWDEFIVLINKLKD